MVKQVTVRNDVPRLDVGGKIVDSHEPCLEFFEGRFYLYGSGYSEHSGWTADNEITCYSSADLESWEFHGGLFPPGRQLAPCVKLNARTGKYVLWHIAEGAYGASVADTPAGPFRTVGRPADLRSPAGERIMHGDFSLFVDDDGTGYLIYTVVVRKSTDPTLRHQIIIERLTEDYLGGTGEASVPLAWNCEAPAMFRRNGTYYALFDNTCCWCRAGTGCRVYTAGAPLGPYAYRGDINRTADADPRRIVSDNADTAPGDGRPDVSIDMQTRRIAELPTPHGSAHILIGDRWQSTPDGMKGHDFTYWTSPLQFDEDGMIRRLEWEDRWTVMLAV